MKNVFELRENEVMEYDVDELMDNEINMFQKQIKNIPEDSRKQFRNWIKIYKILNYDIFEELKLQRIYRFNKCAAIVELTYKGKTEYDFLAFDEDSMTVTVMGIKNNKVKRDYVRRLLIPTNAEEALMYAKAKLDNEVKLGIEKTFKDLQDNKAKYDVTNKLAKYLKLDVKEENKEEVKTEKEKAEEVLEKAVNNVNNVVGDVTNKIGERIQEENKEVKNEVKEENKVYGTTDAIKLVREGKLEEAIEILDKHVYKGININMRKIMIKTFIQRFQIAVQ